MPSCDFNNNDCEGCNGCRTDEEKQKLRDELMNNDDEIFFEFKLKIPKAENLDKIKNICLEIENKKNELNYLIKEYKKLLKKL
jgi:hypothetical protein